MVVHSHTVKSPFRSRTWMLWDGPFCCLTRSTPDGHAHQTDVLCIQRLRTTVFAVPSNGSALPCWMHGCSDCGKGCMPYPAHPTSGPTTSRSPSVLGRSDRIESLHGSVISFVLLHYRLLRVNPLSCGAAMMLHTRPTKHQMAEAVLMCGCRCYMCKCDPRDRATSYDPADSFSSC